MYDLVVKDGTVVSEYTMMPLDVAVKDEKIVALGVRGQFTAAETQAVIEAEGKYVVPGGIDAHVHFDIKLSEAMHAQSAASGSRAALWGGTTTYIDFAYAFGDQHLTAVLDERLEAIASQQPYSDYALHIIIAGDWPLSTAGEIKDVISGGVVSVKFFTTLKGSFMSDDGRIYSAMLETQKHGGITMVHCEDDCIIDYCVRRLYAEGREHFSNIGEARPPLSEEAAVRRMLLLSKRTGSPLYVVHVSAKESLDAINQARSEGVKAFAEVLVPNMLFGPELYRQSDGQRYMNFPPNKSSEHRDALWNGAVNSGVHTISSDDFTFPLKSKLSGATIDNITGGNNSVETRMPVLWSEGVSKRGMSPTRFVELNSATPAKLFGIYGTKGVIRPGADADIVVMDPERAHTFKQGSNLHSDCDYSNWDGWELRGFPTTTILRGHVMIKDGEWVGPKGIGHFVKGRRPEIV